MTFSGNPRKVLHLRNSRLLGSAMLSVAAIVFVSEPNAAMAAPPITALAVSMDGRELVAGSQAGISVYSLPDLKVIRSPETELEAIHDIRFSPDGRRIAVAGGTPAQFGLVEIMEWPSAKVITRIREHDDVVYSVAWHSDGHWLATASLDGVCGVVAADTSQLAHRIEGHSKGLTGVAWISAVIADPANPGAEDSLLVTSSLDQTLRVWSMKIGQPEKPPKLVKTLDQHTGAVIGLALQPVSPSDAVPLLASIGDDRTVRIWQPVTGRLMRFAKLAESPTAVAWTSDGASIVVGTRSGQCVIVDPSTAAFHIAATVTEPIISLAADRMTDRIFAGDQSGTVASAATR